MRQIEQQIDMHLYCWRKGVHVQSIEEFSQIAKLGVVFLSACDIATRNSFFAMKYDLYFDTVIYPLNQPVEFRIKGYYLYRRQVGDVLRTEALLIHDESNLSRNELFILENEAKRNNQLALLLARMDWEMIATANEMAATRGDFAPLTEANYLTERVNKLKAELIRCIAKSCQNLPDTIFEYCHGRYNRIFIINLRKRKIYYLERADKNNFPLNCFDDQYSEIFNHFCNTVREPIEGGDKLLEGEELINVLLMLGEFFIWPKEEKPRIHKIPKFFRDAMMGNVIVHQQAGFWKYCFMNRFKQINGNFCKLLNEVYSSGADIRETSLNNPITLYRYDNGTFGVVVHWGEGTRCVKKTLSSSEWLVNLPWPTGEIDDYDKLLEVDASFIDGLLLLMPPDEALIENDMNFQGGMANFRTPKAGELVTRVDVGQPYGNRENLHIRISRINDIEENFLLNCEEMLPNFSRIFSIAVSGYQQIFFQELVEQLKLNEKTLYLVKNDNQWQVLIFHSYEKQETLYLNDQLCNNAEVSPFFCKIDMIKMDEAQSATDEDSFGEKLSLLEKGKNTRSFPVKFPKKLMNFIENRFVDHDASEKNEVESRFSLRDDCVEYRYLMGGDIIHSFGIKGKTLSQFFLGCSIPSPFRNLNYIYPDQSNELLLDQHIASELFKRRILTVLQSRDQIDSIGRGDASLGSEADENRDGLEVGHLSLLIKSSSGRKKYFTFYKKSNGFAKYYNDKYRDRKAYERYYRLPLWRLDIDPNQVEQELEELCNQIKDNKIRYSIFSGTTLGHFLNWFSKFGLAYKRIRCDTAILSAFYKGGLEDELPFSEEQGSLVSILLSSKSSIPVVLFFSNLIGFAYAHDIANFCERSDTDIIWLIPVFILIPIISSLFVGLSEKIFQKIDNVKKFTWINLFLMLGFTLPFSLKNIFTLLKLKEYSKFSDFGWCDGSDEKVEVLLFKYSSEERVKYLCEIAPINLSLLFIGITSSLIIIPSYNIYLVYVNSNKQQLEIEENKEGVTPNAVYENLKLLDEENRILDKLTQKSLRNKQTILNVSRGFFCFLFYQSLTWFSLKTILIFSPAVYFLTYFLSEIAFTAPLNNLIYDNEYVSEEKSIYLRREDIQIGKSFFIDFFTVYFSLISLGLLQYWGVAADYPSLEFASFIPFMPIGNSIATALTWVSDRFPNCCGCICKKILWNSPSLRKYPEYSGTYTIFSGLIGGVVGVIAVEIFQRESCDHRYSFHEILGLLMGFCYFSFLAIFLDKRVRLMEKFESGINSVTSFFCKRRGNFLSDQESVHDLEINPYDLSTIKVGNSLMC